jgi:hypothetical protein
MPAHVKLEHLAYAILADVIPRRIHALLFAHLEPLATVTFALAQIAPATQELQ